MHDEKLTARTKQAARSEPCPNLIMQSEDRRSGRVLVAGLSVEQCPEAFDVTWRSFENAAVDAAVEAVEFDDAHLFSAAVSHDSLAGRVGPHKQQLA